MKVSRRLCGLMVSTMGSLVKGRGIEALTRKITFVDITSRPTLIFLLDFVFNLINVDSFE